MLIVSRPVEKSVNEMKGGHAPKFSGTYDTVIVVRERNERRVGRRDCLGYLGGIILAAKLRCVVY